MDTSGHNMIGSENGEIISVLTLKKQTVRVADLIKRIACVLAMYCIYSVNIKMSNLYDLYLAYQGKRNIFEEVKRFHNYESFKQ